MLKRLSVYLWEMFPPIHWIASLLIPVSFFCALAQLNNVSLIDFNGGIWASLSFIFFSLLLRVMDEFKDYEDDLKNYPTRPLPSGKVLHRDLNFLMGIVLLVIALLNLSSMAHLIGSLIVVFQSYLMFKWFFCEDKIRKSLVLALISHHPIVYTYYGYLFYIFYSHFSGTELSSFFMMIPLAFLATNWEISRKIRSPKDEDDYTTYSILWGTRRAVFVALSCQLLSLLGGIYYFHLIEAVKFEFLFSALYILVTIPYIIFLYNLKGEGPRPLRKYSEYQGLIFQVLIILEYFIKG